MNKKITNPIEKQPDHIKVRPRVDPRCLESLKRTADSFSPKEMGIRTHCVCVYKHTTQTTAASVWRVWKNWAPSNLHVTDETWGKPEQQ